MGRVYIVSNEDKKVEDEMDSVHESNETKNQIMKYQLSLTFVLILAWITTGLRAAVDSTCLPDQRDRLGITNEQMADIMAFGSIPALIGGFLGGSLADVFSSHALLIMFLFLSITCVISIILRYILNYTVYFILSMILAFAFPPVDIIGNSLILQVWGVRATGPMYALHLGFGIGATIGPFIARPFLSPDPVNNNCSSIFTTESTVTEIPPRFQEGSQIEVPYIIISSISMAIALTLLAFYIKGPPEAVREKIYKLSNTERQPFKRVCHPSACANGSNVCAVFFIIAFTLFYIWSVGREVAFNLYLFTLATESDLGFSKDKAAALSSLYNLFYLFGRIVSIPLTRWLKIQVLLNTEIAVYFILSLIMAAWGMEQQSGFAALTCIIGFFGSPIWPGNIAWTDKYITVTSTAMYMVMFGTSVGYVVFPRLYGRILDNENYERVMILASLCAAIQFGQFVIQQVIGCQQGERIRDDDKNNYDKDNESDIYVIEFHKSDAC